MIKVYRFHAEWCSPCKASEPSWNSFKMHNIHLQFEDINVDEDSVTTEKYDVLSVPTVIITKDDKVIRKRTGSFTERDLDILVGDYSLM